MYNIKDLRQDQIEAIRFILTHQNTMLWVSIGGGKTVITLSSIVERMKKGKIKKTLIFAPIRVIQSAWLQEIQKWAHLNHLKVSVIRGDSKKRLNAFLRDADIYLCNYELMNWLSEILKKYFFDKPFPFECVVYDEVTKLKTSTTSRMTGGNRTRLNKFNQEYTIKKEGWKQFLKKIPYKIGLTGTPAANGYMDLHGQYLAVDAGELLGEYITHYRNAYFNKDYNGFSYNISNSNKKIIEEKISKITFRLDSQKYIQLPKVLVKDVILELPEKVKKSYKELEKQFFTKLDSGTEIELFNKASLSNKCLQFANGFPFTDDQRNYETLHKEKLEALEDILEDANGNPVLCSYTYTSDALEIMKHFKKLNPVNLSGVPAAKTNSIIKKWNNGEIKLLIGHPLSMGHGVDGLQHSGSIIVWFGLNWSYELYEQMNGRLFRNGQTKPVSVVRLLMKDTIDEAVLEAIESKCQTQEDLKKAIDKYRKKQ